MKRFRLSKKMIRKHPEDQQYLVTLGTVIHSREILIRPTQFIMNCFKTFLPTRECIAMLAAQFYQNGNIDYAIKIFEQGPEIAEQRYSVFVRTDQPLPL